MTMRMAQRFCVIIFDLDGTLVHSAPDIISALYKTHEIIKQKCQDENFRQHYGLSYAVLRERNWHEAPIGPHLRHLLQNFCYDYTAQDIEFFMQEFRRVYDNSDFTETTPYPYIRDYLKKLREVFELWIVTNKPEGPAIELLESLRLRHFFAGILSPTTPPPESPLLPSLEKGPLLKWLCEYNGWDKNRVLYVGDTEADMEAARYAGIVPVAALWGYGLRNNWDRHWDERQARFSFESFKSMAESFLNLNNECLSENR